MFLGKYTITVLWQMTSQTIVCKTKIEEKSWIMNELIIDFIKLLLNEYIEMG